VTPRFRKWLFETLYKNCYLYRFASTVPFAGQWRVWQRLVLPRLHGHDVLELGCGLGDLLADMLADGYNCRAVEHSPQMVAAARATLRKRKVGQPLWVIQGSAQSLPFPDSTFDTVVSTFPSDYISDPDTIAEVARVLRPGGRLIIVFSANLLPVGFLQPLLVLIHILVYGPSALLSRRKRSKPNEQLSPTHTIRSDADPEVISEEVTVSKFGSLIPLERFGLQGRSECVRSQRWEALIIIGQKTNQQQLQTPLATSPA
jgi:ubiquinone/menaquinone biosynthesis C-methylase UbiE